MFDIYLQSLFYPYMEPFNILPQILYYATTDPNKAYELLAPYIHYLAPFILPVLPELEKTPDDYSLSLIFFCLKKYKKAITHYIRCNGQKNREYDPIYYAFFKNAIKVRILELFANKNVQKYIIFNAEEDPLLITFCMGDKELLRGLLQRSGIPLSVLQCVAEEEDTLDLFYEVVSDFTVTNEDLRIFVDAYVFTFNKKKLVSLIEGLIITDLPKCFELCFYINDSHPSFFDLNEIRDIGNYKSVGKNEDDMKSYKADPEVKANIEHILTGDLKSKTILSLLAKNNKTDFSFLSSLVKSITRSSSTHSAISYANGIMNLGTSNDSFFRMNQDLMNMAKHWNKFMSISCLGMIHLGTNGLDLLRNILPNDQKDEGGSLLALGLIENIKGRRDEVLQAFFLNSMEDGHGSIKFGSALGYGLINLGSGSSVVQNFYDPLSLEDEGSEGAALGIGMILVGLGMGSGSRRGKAIDVVRSVIKKVAESPTTTPTLRDQMKQSKYLVEDRPDIDNSTNTETIGSDPQVEEENGNLRCVFTDPEFNPEKPHENSFVLESSTRLYTIACETEHERLSRSCGIALSLMAIRTRTVDDYVKNMLVHRSEVLRYSACFCVGSAFAGTSNLDAITLLSTLINDSSEDVKRACVLGLGFVCCNKHDVLLNVLEPLATNHSPGVRGAVALALGFFMSGTANKQCCDIIEVLLYDIDLLVRQSACIGMGFILAQSTQNHVTQFTRIVERINYLVLEKQENNSVTIGAVIGRSLMEGGGRNIIYGVKNLYGKIEKTKIAGAIIFMQYWYNYNLFSFVSLTILPTFYVVLDCGLGMVDMEIPTRAKKEDYDINIIKLPDMKIKKKRRYRRRFRTINIDDDKKEDLSTVVILTVAEDTDYIIRSGERMTVWEKKGSQMVDYGFKFV